jgi:hypothetical protein
MRRHEREGDTQDCRGDDDLQFDDHGMPPSAGVALAPEFAQCAIQDAILGPVDCPLDRSTLKKGRFDIMSCLVLSAEADAQFAGYFERYGGRRVASVNFPDKIIAFLPPFIEVEIKI